MSDDLIAWLRAQLDDDERVAQEASDWPWEPVISSSGEQGDVQGVTSAFEDYCCSAEDATHIARWDPNRVLDEVEAKRRIIDEIEEHWDDANPIGGRGSMFLPAAWDRVLRLLAQPYADRPGFPEEWRP